jgi:glycosyltransferase involved in cell wall biosynthesis
VDKVRNVNPTGEIHNIKYEYVNGETIWPNHFSKIRKAFIIYSGLFLLLKKVSIEKPRSIILVSNKAFLILFLWIICKSYGINYYQEKSEYPPVVKKKVSLLYKKSYLQLYKLFHGMIVMTEELHQYFLNLGQNNIFHLPMSVDHSRFVNIKKTNALPKYFAYCGGGNYERDGLWEMIQAFVEFNKGNPDYEFLIIGDIINSSPYFQKIYHYAQKDKLKEKIKFVGRKSSDEIPGLLGNAQCLMMAPQKNFQSGGFPTKLGEYLATGIPVICTKVSEIPHYLSDKDALLVDPGNHEQLVTAMQKIVSNPQSCSRMGKNGRLIAQKYFSIDKYILNLIQFLNLD